MTMANVFTPVLRNLVDGMLRIARERIPLTRIVQTNSMAEDAVVGQSINIGIAPTVAARAFTRGPYFTESANRTVTNTAIIITEEQEAPFTLTGEDFLAMVQTPEYIPKSYEQAVRTIANLVHSTLAGLHVEAAGNYGIGNIYNGAVLGTAGTTPFGSDANYFAEAAKLLDDSLAPSMDRFLMLDSSSKFNLQKLDKLTKANEAGTDEMLRTGIIGRLAGINAVPSDDVKLGATVAGSGYVTDGIQAVGATDIVVKTGTGILPKGAVIAFAGDTANKYVLKTAWAGGAGTITLTSGLVNAIADANAITASAGRRNMAFHREAIGLAIRLPSIPKDGDAGQHQTLMDPVSGLTFRVSKYLGIGENQYKVSCAWGAKVVRPELLKLILG
jgi:hypothetical protein